MRKHIEPIRAFSARERSDLGMHSLLNDFNVILGQLYILGILLRDDEYAYPEAIERTKAFLVETQARPDPLLFTWGLTGFRQQFLHDCFLAVADLPEGFDTDEVRLTLQTADATFEKLMRRACETYPLIRDDFQALAEVCKPAVFWRQLAGLEKASDAEIRFWHYQSARSRVAVEMRLDGSMDAVSRERCLCPLQLLIPYLLDRAESEKAGGRVKLKLTCEGPSAVLAFDGVSCPEDLPERRASGEALEPENHLAAFSVGCRWMASHGCEVTIEPRPEDTGFNLNLEPLPTAHD